MAPHTHTSRVPFKWEEAAGKPIPPAHTPPCAPDTVKSSSPLPTSCLQLPPKLQCPLDQGPLSLPPRLHPHTPLTVQLAHGPSPDHHKLKRLYAYLLKPASWSHPLTHPSPCPSWSTSASDPKHNHLASNERFFFDEALPKQLNYSTSMPDSWKARVPLHHKYKQQGTQVNGEAQLSCLAMEEHVESDASSMILHERHGSACPWQPNELGVDDYDDDDDEGFHDFSSTASSSLEKLSHRSDDSMESSSPPWFFDFNPEELGVHYGKERSNLVVKLVAIVNIKKILTSKLCKLRKRVADQQVSMWSPTLATYLYNERKEEKEGAGVRHKKEEEDDDDASSSMADRSPSSHTDRSPSSHMYRINPDYHPPSLILRTHLQSDDDSFDRRRSSSFGLQFLNERDDEEEKEEERPQEGLQTLRHRLSLREQLAEFDDEYLLEIVPKDQSLAPSNLDSQRGEPLPGKGMCKVRNTVKVLVTTIKLILVQTEVKKKKGGQRPSCKIIHCFKPTIDTLTPVSSTHNQALY